MKGRLRSGNDRFRIHWEQKNHKESSKKMDDAYSRIVSCRWGNLEETAKHEVRIVLIKSEISKLDSDVNKA